MADGQIEILVVDANSRSRAELQTRIGGLGHPCRTAPGTEEAWRLLLETRAPVVLSDDLDLCRRIRQQWPESYTYFIALCPEHDRTSCLKIGADQALSRPVSVEELEAALIAADRVLGLRLALDECRQQLVQSSKLSAVGQLAAGIAHELNTPLGAIMLQVESALLRLDRDPQKAAAKLEAALKATGQARNIVRKLLTYSAQNRQMEIVKLDVVLEDTLELLGKQLRLDGVELVQHLQPVPPLRGCPSELQQVMTNLLLNARDALAERASKGTIEIGLSAANGRVELSVSDDGPGVPEELQDRIFEPFFTTKPVGKGTGLGLAISRQILERHGGWLECRSRPGESIFTVVLPVEDDSEQ
ncbi:MAG: hypothetical protein HY319_23155 [Armatimonadetes bacterium]|nr:hypothetical protein [Armatimonadota bacterium]